jgi:multidrug resistance efflux pump
MTMRSSRQNILRPGRLHPQVLPFLVWIAAIAAVVILFYRGSQQFQVVGIAQGEVAQVCAPVDGRLKAVYVQLFETVSKDQVVAALDDEVLAAQIATVAATAEHLRSQLKPTEEQIMADNADREVNNAEEQRRFAMDVERARLDILGLKAQIASDRITLEDYAAEVKIATDLLEKNTIAPYELDKARALYDALAEKVSQMEIHLAQAEEQLKETRRRQDEFTLHKAQRPTVDAALEAIRKETAIQEKLIEELGVQRRALVMTAPIDGVVVQISARTNEAPLRRSGEGTLRKTGEVVLAGEPIMVIAQSKPTEIMAYAMGGQMDGIKVGQKVELAKKTGQPQIARSRVTYVGPIVEQVPSRLWLNPNAPQWGLPFIVEIPEGMQLTSGEVVGIRGL